MGFVKKLFKNKLFIKVLSLIAVVCIAIICVRVFLFKDEATLTSDALVAALTKASDLTTAKLNYTGVATYEDTGIKLLTRSDFIMTYDATVWAGINLAEVKPEVDNIAKIVWITIPKATIQDVKVDPSSIKYVTEKFALVNFNEKEDANNAQVLAEKEAVEQANNMGILELADQQAETLIRGILETVVPKDYQIKVKD